MNKNNEIKTFVELKDYYREFFYLVLKNKKSVLYVGYENEDFLLNIIADTQIYIVAIDREKRTNIPYKNVKYKQMDFLDIEKEANIYYDVIIFSFVLHENMLEIQNEMIKLAKQISQVVIIIEPLHRHDIYGDQFEKTIAEKFSLENKVKCYYDETYWKKLVDYDERVDEIIILYRSKSKNLILLKDKKGRLFPIHMQDIMIMICANERKKI